MVAQSSRRVGVRCSQQRFDCLAGYETWKSGGELRGEEDRRWIGAHETLGEEKREERAQRRETSRDGSARVVRLIQLGEVDAHLAVRQAQRVHAGAFGPLKVAGQVGRVGAYGVGRGALLGSEMDQIAVDEKLSGLGLSHRATPRDRRPP